MQFSVQWMTSKFQRVAQWNVNQSNKNNSPIAAYPVAALFQRMCKLINQHPPVTHVWLGPLLLIAVTDPKQIEVKWKKILLYISLNKIHNIPCVSLTTHIHIVSRLRISGAILPLPPYPFITNTEKLCSLLAAVIHIHELMRTVINCSLTKYKDIILLAIIAT